MLLTVPAGITKVDGPDGTEYKVAGGIVDVPDAIAADLLQEKGFAAVPIAQPDQVTKIIDLALLRGEKGDKGDSIKGDAGDVGPMPTHRWGDTALQFELPGKRWGEPIELKGDPGPKGEQGPIGPMPRHRWNATSLQFERSPGVWGELVDLQGPKGDKGETRVVPGGGGMPSSTPASGATITGSATQVAVCDGAGNAAGSADLTFITADRAFYVNDRFNGTANLAINGGGVDPGAWAASLQAGQSSVTLSNGAGALLVSGNVQFTVFDSGDPSGQFLQAGGAPVIPQSDNTLDLGAVADGPFGADLRWRTGYFGTSVVSPLYVAGATPGITDTIDLTTATSITVVGGIITGWA